MKPAHQKTPLFWPGKPLRLLGVLVMAGWLAACATAPTPAPVQSPQVQQARSAEQGGQWRQAGQLWATAAQATTNAADAGEYWVNSANAWLNAGLAEQANRSLIRADYESLRPGDEARSALMRAEMALQRGDLQAAEFYLDVVRGKLSGTWQKRYQASALRLQQLQADPSAPVLAKVRDQIQAMPDVNVAQALQILRSLEAVPTERLTELSALESQLSPWAQLALSVRQALLRRQDLLSAATAWQQRHPDHAVGPDVFMELCWQYGQYFTPPAKIAVLLPAQGRFEAAGAAVRDGLVSAFLENPAAASLDFFPLNEGPASVLEAYQQAVDQGYQWVIGPISQEQVQTLVEDSSAELPALLLNWPERQPELGIGQTTPWFSLSLSQQAESQAVAQRMLADGNRRAILLLAQGSWGERTEQAFIDAYLDGGGEIIALERFSANDADHSQKLTQLLEIEASRERKRRLQSALSLRLEFEPSRRDDFEAIFMAADPTLGRQLKPQLRFFDAGSKPVYAMSRVYSGQVAAGQDQDLNGVVIPGTRWALNEAQQGSRSASEPGLASLRNGSFSALHALGRDAWNLLPWLQWMHRDPGFTFPGEIGELSVSMDGRIVRQPIWLQFQRGRPLAVTEQTDSP